MPTFIHGKKTYFALATAGTPGTVVNISDHLFEVGWPRNADEVETTTFGAGDYKTYIAGFKDAQINLSGRFTAAMDAQLDALLGFDTPVNFEYGPEGNAVGKVKYSGKTRVLSYELSNAVGDAVNWSATLRMTEAPVRGAF